MEVLRPDFYQCVSAIKFRLAVAGGIVGCPMGSLPLWSLRGLGFREVNGDRQTKWESR